MAGALVTVYRRSANRKVEAIEMTRDEAEFSVARWPFAWSFDQKSFAPRPWPPERVRGKPVDPPAWSPPQ
jgi:hypothetical protein